MSQLVFQSKGKEHTSQSSVIHNVQSSSSYRIGNTQVICGITTSIKEYINDGSSPIFFNCIVNTPELCRVVSPLIGQVGPWLNEVINDKNLFSNTDQLLVKSSDNQLKYYQKISMFLYVIDDDGSVFDVSLYAAIKALLNLNIVFMCIDADGCCKESEQIFHLNFRYIPIPFSFYLKTPTDIGCHLSFVLSDSNVHHIHMHGGKALLSSQVLLGCISKCRTIYKNCVQKLQE
ncbi:Ribosomal RNA-processing protein 43 [Entamoeba marina]